MWKSAFDVNFVFVQHHAPQHQVEWRISIFDSIWSFDIQKETTVDFHHNRITYMKHA